MRASLPRILRGALGAAALAGLPVAELLAAPALEAAAEASERKHEAALERLRSFRREVEAERLPLARELNRLERRAAALEDEAERLRRLRDNRDVELDALASRVRERESQVEYVSRTLLPSFFADLEAALSPPERQTSGEAIRAHNLFLEEPDATELEKLDSGLGLMAASLKDLEALLGGRRLEGRARAPSGEILSGDFAKLGPLAYFAAEAGAETVPAGLALDARSGPPELRPLSGSASEAIRRTLESGRGTLPVDPTLGDALALEETRDSLKEHLAKGGIWVYPILLFALAAAVVAVVKLAQVLSVRDPQSGAIHDIVAGLRKGDTERARQRAAAQPEPFRGMLVAAVENAGESAELVEEVMYESMLTTQPKLERFLNVIAVTAAAAPLLGLLGTVTGIIKTFQLMTVFGAGDPKPLISGISEALITTELGLILAIPSLVIHALLARKVSGIMARMEQNAVTLLNGLSRGGGELGPKR